MCCACACLLQFKCDCCFLFPADYIKIEVTNENSIDKFIKEASDADIHSNLETNLNTYPKHNYDILAKHLQLAKNKHIPQKI